MRQLHRLIRVCSRQMPRWKTWMKSRRTPPVWSQIAKKRFTLLWFFGKTLQLPQSVPVECPKKRRKLRYIFYYAPNAVFLHVDIFCSSARGFFSCFRLRGMQEARVNTAVKVWALAEVRSTCSEGSKWRKLASNHGTRFRSPRASQVPCKTGTPVFSCA